jgi:hypothetical protein
MVASDIFIMKSTAVFSLLGRDGDHIRTDYGFAGAFLSFTQVVVLPFIANMQTLCGAA